jgi:hypothetical protein
VLTAAIVSAALLVAIAATFLLVSRGAVTVDLGIGRTVRPLGPINVRIAAPREIVFEVVSEPYLGRTPRTLESKLRVIERSEDMVLAAHFTQLRGLVATTLETVRFESPSRVDFHLVRGPVPHVAEQFLLHDDGSSTELEYRGELGTDFWALGRRWGNLVARKWERTVHASLETVKTEAERRAAASR